MNPPGYSAPAGGCLRCHLRRYDGRAGRQSGFSLLELLVVVFLIVLVTSMVSLSVGGGGDTRLELQVRDLVETAEYAVDEAQFTGLDYGLLVEQVYSADGSLYRYSWRERRVDGWQEPESGKEIFAAREWPAGIAMELEIEDSPFAEDDPDEVDDPEDEKRPPNPQIVLYASGETTVGAISVRRGDDSELLWRIEWDLLGRFKMLLRGEESYDEEPG